LWKVDSRKITDRNMEKQYTVTESYYVKPKFYYNVYVLTP